MSSDAAHAYIQSDSIGDFEACQEQQDSLDAVIQDLYSKNMIGGYQIIIIESGDQEEEELVPSKLTHAKTNGLYPYLFARIQPAEDNSYDIDDMMNRHNTIRIL